MRPSTLASVEKLAARRPHGDRVKYMAGCRCLPCRAANSRYETKRAALRRAGLANGLVNARRARKHLLKLSCNGVGRRTVGTITGISDSVLFKIRSGQRKQIRALTEKAILEVDTSRRRGSTLVPATETWKRIDRLLSEGFTRARIARELGRKMPALQLDRDFVTAKNERAVLELCRRYE